MNDMKTKLLLKAASGDKSITILGDIAKLNKKATPDPTTPPKPSYMDTLNNYYNDTVNYVKNRWDKLSPETLKTVGDIGLGVAGGLTGDALVRLLGGKRNKALRLLGMIGGVGAGMAANSYLQSPDLRDTVKTGFNSLINKFKS